MAWAVGMTERVNRIGELSFSLWTPVFSPGIGRLTWSTWVESVSSLEALEGKLIADDDYVAEVDRGAAFASNQGVDDSLMQLVHGTVDPQRRPQYAAVVQAALAPGAFRRGMQLGVSIAERVKAISGLDTAFVIGATGTYGGVGWITGYDDLDQMQRAEEAVNGDAGFIEFLDTEAADAFQPSVTTQTVVRRVV